MPPQSHRPSQEAALLDHAVCLDHPIDARAACVGDGRIDWHASITVTGTDPSYCSLLHSGDEFDALK
jgi:hypothetical protein